MFCMITIACMLSYTVSMICKFIENASKFPQLFPQNVLDPHEDQNIYSCPAHDTPYNRPYRAAYLAGSGSLPDAATAPNVAAAFTRWRHRFSSCGIVLSVVRSLNQLLENAAVICEQNLRILYQIVAEEHNFSGIQFGNNFRVRIGRFFGQVQSQAASDSYP